MKQKELFNDSIEELTTKLGNAQPQSPMAHAVEAELKRRNTISQMEVAEAQKEAAKAAKRTATWTMISAIAMAISAAFIVVSYFSGK